jgi:hypothetical protein
LDNGDESRFREGAERYQSGCAFSAPGVFLACFQHARIYSPELLVLNRAGDIVFESAVAKPEVLENNGILDRLSLPSGPTVPGVHCLLGHPWSYGYYHWLFEALPRLALIQNVPSLTSVPLIVPAELKRFQKETLRLAGIGDSRVVPFTGRCWQVEKLYFPSLPAPSGNPSPHAVEWLRSTFGSGRKDQDGLPAGKGRRLYLSRSDAPQRKLLNEAEITAWLQSVGFEIYCAGEHSFADQVATFEEAACVIAPHGAAVSNMVFAPPQAKLIELFGRNYVNGCYWALSNILGQRYGCVTGPCVGLDFSVPLDSVKALMEQMGI